MPEDNPREPWAPPRLPTRQPVGLRAWLELLWAVFRQIRDNKGKARPSSSRGELEDAVDRELERRRREVQDPDRDR